MKNNKNEHDLLPRIFCIADIKCKSDDEGCQYRAVLQHGNACLTVSFNADKRDPRLKQGSFASIRWLPATRSEHGAIQITGLTARSCAAKGFNPFVTVPHTSSVDRNLINFTRDLWGAAPKAMRQMLMAAILDRMRMQGGGGT